MGQARRSLLVVHNQDFTDADDAELASRADVENAARDVTAALVERGHQARTLALPLEPRAAVAALGALADDAHDLIFNLCESLAGEARHEPVLPTLLELYGVPYTGSGPAALATALRKDHTKAILRAAGLPTPAAAVSLAGQLPDALPPLPLIVKPVGEDGSTGIWLRSVVHERTELAPLVAEVAARYRQPVLLEAFVPGREIYVSLIGNGAAVAALPPHEIDFSEMPAGAPHIVTYDGKWAPDSLEYRGTRPVRARLDEAPLRRCEEVARAAFLALDLRDYARIDLRLSEDGRPFIIDVNPNCDLSSGAGVARAASFAGLGYTELIERIVVAALGRYHLPHQARQHASEPGRPALSSRVVTSKHPRAQEDGSLTARGAREERRPVHGGGGGGGAGAHRQRAR